MKTLLLITERQDEQFHKKCAEYGLGVREDSNGEGGKYYEVAHYNGADLFFLGSSLGFTEGLQAAHQPSKLLQN